LQILVKEGNIKANRLQSELRKRLIWIACRFSRLRLVKINHLVMRFRKIPEIETV